MGLEDTHHIFKKQSLKKNMRYWIEVLQVKSLSPRVKDDVLEFFILLMYYGHGICDAFEKGMERVHFEFH